jgi:hypothetical protein
VKEEKKERRERTGREKKRKKRRICERKLFCKKVSSRTLLPKTLVAAISALSALKLH